MLDRVEHPSLKPGQPVAVFPAAIGGLNYSPASYDPATNYIINAAAETAGVMIQKKLTPTQKKRKLVGDIFLGLANGDFGTLAARLAGTTARSARSTSTRAAGCGSSARPNLNEEA